MSLHEEYLKAVEDYNTTKAVIEKFNGFTISLKEMLDYNIHTGQILNDVVAANFTFNSEMKNKQNALLKYSFKEYSLCALVNSEKHIWLSKRKVINGKDYPGKYQVTGGSLDVKDYTEEDPFLSCAKREAYEESGIEINSNDLQFVLFQEGSRIFPDGIEHLYKTAMYFVDIEDQIPKNMEPDKQEDWFLTSISELKEYKKERMMTGTLNSKLDQLVKKINAYFILKNKRNKRKRPRVENEENTEKSNEISADENSEIVENN